VKSPIDNILIVANSGRLLAQLANNEGISCLVIDCFADSDTQQYALQSIAVDSLALINVKQALSCLKKQHHFSHIIYGSGLENQLPTLQYLEKNFTILGNSSSVFSTIQNKSNFFLQLKNFGIRHPEVSFYTPDKPHNWLIKPLKGEGGVGVKRYIESAEKLDDCYWQKYCEGFAKSVLFVANGEDYQIMGVHQQYISQSVYGDFLFSGLINQLEINKELQQQLNDILTDLVPEFALKGINSLDFIESDGQCFVLEINPRPSASLNLYSSNLFSVHINIFLGDGELNSINRLSSCQAYKIIFAEEDMTLEHAIDWPGWVSDRPQKGAIIHTGMPICSIIADGQNERQVEDLLQARQQTLIKLF